MGEMASQRPGESSNTLLLITLKVICTMLNPCLPHTARSWLDTRGRVKDISNGRSCLFYVWLAKPWARATVRCADKALRRYVCCPSIICWHEAELTGNRHRIIHSGCGLCKTDASQKEQQICIQRMERMAT